MLLEVKGILAVVPESVALRVVRACLLVLLSVPIALVPQHSLGEFVLGLRTFIL